MPSPHPLPLPHTQTRPFSVNSPVGACVIFLVQVSGNGWNSALIGYQTRKKRITKQIIMIEQRKKRQQQRKTTTDNNTKLDSKKLCLSVFDSWPRCNKLMPSNLWYTLMKKQNYSWNQAPWPNQTRWIQDSFWLYLTSILFRKIRRRSISLVLYFSRVYFYSLIIYLQVHCIFKNSRLSYI